MKEASNRKRSIAKAITWRATATIDTFVISLLITGRVGWASAIAGVEIATKILLYYFHERMWSKSSWGKVKNIKI